MLSAGFYVIGLYYRLLVGAFVGLIEMVPIIGSILILAVGVRQSLHVAALSLLGSRPSAGSRALRRQPTHRADGRALALVTLLSVAVVEVLFGGLAVILASQ